MSTSKFFTWSKGDRKHASTGIGPGPIEYIPIKGMGNGSDSKVWSVDGELDRA